MIIPKDPVERKSLYDDLIRQCTVTRQARFNFYEALRSYYLFGAKSSSGSPYNKIASTVDTLCSFIYTPDTTRFSLHLGTEATPEDIHKGAVLSKEVTDQWRISRTHLLFSSALRWACVFGCVLLKGMWRKNNFKSYMVEPHQFGVLREDVTELSDQEAFTHHYTITRTQLEADLRDNPRKNMILSHVNRGVRDNVDEGYSSGLSRLILGGGVGGVSGSLAQTGGMSAVDGGIDGGGGPTYNYVPMVDATLVDMCDLYVWNDDISDYQLATYVAKEVILYDRPASVLGHVKGMPAFTKVSIDTNLYDYFWGDSFVARLTWLQDLRTRRLMQIMDLLEKQVDPPRAFIGAGGIQEEKLAALRKAGGQVSFSNPTAKVEVQEITMPSNVFTEIAELDRMFDDIAGIGHVLQGKGEAGVRSRGQADLMARLGSSRPKDRAIVAEESAEDMARLMLRTVQDHSEQRFQVTLPDAKKMALPNGGVLTFLAEQFTHDYEVKVDAHSTSPIFIEDRKHDAMTLLEAKAIDRETLLDMFDPPNVQELKERLKVIQEQEQAARMLEMKMQAEQGKYK